MKGIFSSLRCRMILLLLLGGLPTVALTLYSAGEQRRDAARDVQQNALRMVRLASAGQQQLVEGARQLLTMMSQLAVIRGNDAAASHEFLAGLLAQYPNYANFGVAETNGDIFASGLPLGEKINLADRSYFQRTMATRDFAMGDYQIGRITRKPTVNFGYPVLDATGRLIRIVYAAVDLTWLEELARRTELPNQSALTVIDNAGTILARFPDSEKWRGQSITNQEAARLLRSGIEGTFQADGVDGLPRLYAYTPLRGAQGAGSVNVSIGIPTQVAFADANYALIRNITLLLVVGIIAIGAAWWGSSRLVLQPVNELVRMTRKIQVGDLSARVGMTGAASELNQLSNAFDDMANSLELRIAERRKAEDALRALNEQLESRVKERTRELNERNDEMVADLAMAREMQMALLPATMPTFPTGVPAEKSAIRFTRLYQPSGAVGGDFFIIHPLSECQAGVFLCDVMGHGISPALITALIRGLVEELRPLAADPGKFLTTLNRGMCTVLREAGTTTFASAIYAVIDARTQLMRYSIAGHPHPFHLRQKSKTVEAISFAKKEIGPVLGLIEETTYPTLERKLDTGDVLIIYTDGIFEVPGKDNEEYGEDRLLGSFAKRASLDVDTLFKEVVGEVRAWSANSHFLDDVCLLGVQLDADCVVAAS